MQTANPLAIDLFAGAGGLSWGLHGAGLATPLAVEQDKWAAETYRANFPNSTVLQRDIESFTDDEISAYVALRPALIAGGPPCQGFSHSNVLNRDPKDPRNSLFRQFLRWVRLIRPPFFLIENVAGLLSAKTESREPVMDVIERSASEIGYFCEWRLLQATEFGVPQRRERLFIIGARSPELLASFSWPRPTHDARQPVTLWDAISDLAEGDEPYSSKPRTSYQQDMRAGYAHPRPTSHEPMRHTARVVARFESIGFGESEASVAGALVPQRRGGGGEGRAYAQNSRRQRPDAPCSTIVASSHTNFIHPVFHRNFTVRELLRIQSFPDHFVMRGKRAVLSRKLSLRKGLHDDIYLDQRMQIGNAVPPRLAEKLGREILNAASTSSVVSDAA